MYVRRALYEGVCPNFCVSGVSFKVALFQQCGALTGLGGALPPPYAENLECCYTGKFHAQGLWVDFAIGKGNGAANV